jgi:anti-anti-sigma factor
MRLQSPTLSRAEQIVRLAALSMVSEREGDIHAIALTGELDLANAAGLDRELRRVEATDAEVILVDLWGLSFIDSSGMKVLVAAAARSRARNRLVLQAAPAGVLRVLHIAGIADLLPLAG